MMIFNFLLLLGMFHCGRMLGQREGTDEDRERANQDMNAQWLAERYDL